MARPLIDSFYIFVFENLILMAIILWCFLQYYAESHAVIYVIDSSDHQRIDESKQAFGKFNINYF